MNGSVWANGDLLPKSAKINGDVFAAENPELSAAGTISGVTHVSNLNLYNSTYGTQVRPTNPSAPLWPTPCRIFTGP